MKQDGNTILLESNGEIFNSPKTKVTLIYVQQ